MTDRQFGFLLKMASEGYVDTHAFSKAAAVPVTPPAPVVPNAPAVAQPVQPAATVPTPEVAPAAPVAEEKHPYKDARGRLDQAKYRKWYRDRAAEETRRRREEAEALYKERLREDEEYYRTRGVHNKNVEAAKDGKPNPPPATAQAPGKPSHADLWHNSSVDLGSVKDPYGGIGGVVERVQAIRDAEAARKAQEGAVDFGQPSSKPLFNTEGQPTEPSPESVAPARTEQQPVQPVQPVQPPAYTPTAQMARITRSFDALPQREQFRMLSEAGIDLNDYLMATDEERDGMIRAAVIADAKLRGTIRRR